jgi:dihydroxyacetone kinase-like predicted kinase
MKKNHAVETEFQIKPKSTCTGYELRQMFYTATNWLEKNVSAINALNVFPVPDGDTGTNMLLTMRSTKEEAAKLQADSVPAIAQAMARGSLMGARGNGGVILSQIVRGLLMGWGMWNGLARWK